MAKNLTALISFFIFHCTGFLFTENAQDNVYVNMCTSMCSRSPSLLQSITLQSFWAVSVLVQSTVARDNLTDYNLGGGNFCKFPAAVMQ